MTGGIGKWAHPRIKHRISAITNLLAYSADPDFDCGHLPELLARCTMKLVVHIEWDDAKESLNIHLHGIDFTLAAQAARDPHRSELFDVDHSDDEDRWTIIGMARSTPVILRVTISETAEGEFILIISARKANAAQRALYLKQRKA
jgi:uncharacterized protein